MGGILYRKGYILREACDKSSSTSDVNTGTSTVPGTNLSPFGICRGRRVQPHLGCLGLQPRNPTRRTNPHLSPSGAGGHTDPREQRRRNAFETHAVTKEKGKDLDSGFNISTVTKDLRLRHPSRYMSNGYITESFTGRERQDSRLLGQDLNRLRISRELLIPSI
jgi:hypothetical protein